jgi:hypothetical protein
MKGGRRFLYADAGEMASLRICGEALLSEEALKLLSQVEPHAIIIYLKALRLEKTQGFLIERPYTERQRIDPLRSGIRLGGGEQGCAYALASVFRGHNDLMNP